MCKQVQQCVTDAVKQVCICDGAQRIPSPRKGEGAGAEHVRQDITEEVMLSRDSATEHSRKGKTGIKVQGHESSDIFRELQVI